MWPPASRCGRRTWHERHRLFAGTLPRAILAATSAALAPYRACPLCGGRGGNCGGAIHLAPFGQAAPGGREPATLRGTGEIGSTHAVAAAAQGCASDHAALRLLAAPLAAHADSRGSGRKAPCDADA